MLNSNYQEQAKKILQKWNYQTIRKVGKGGFGHVVLASKFTNSMSFYAIKCFSLKNSAKDANFKKYIQKEAKTMCGIDHPNVVRFETSFHDGGWYFIVMEYCDMGNLFSYQSKASNKILGLSQASKILMQILNGVQTLHRQNIMHRDIKCQNIFLKKNKIGTGFICKIGDFGFAKQIDESTRTLCGTTLFMAPQVLKKVPYSFQADIWSIGVVFYFMLFGQYPFKSINIEKDIQEKCYQGFQISDPPNYYKDKKQFTLIQDLFTKIFELDQKKRIKLEQIRSHQLFCSSQRQITDDSFSDQQFQQQLEWCLEKINFIEDLIADLSNLRFLQPFLLHSSRFYLFKIILSLSQEENIVGYKNEQKNHKLCQELQNKQTSVYASMKKQFEKLQKFSTETKKINKFIQGFNLQAQDFYSIKQGYRNTLSMIYSEVQRKISQQPLKSQLKLRILCCHLINRVFYKGFQPDVFPNFSTWVKNKKNTKIENKTDIQFGRFKEWIMNENADKVVNEIQNINRKFYC